MPDPTRKSQGSPPDRRVVGLIATLVVAILVVNLVSAMVPGIDAALASLPIVVLVLVGGTLLVLAQGLRH